MRVERLSGEFGLGVGVAPGVTVGVGVPNGVGVEVAPGVPVEDGVGVGVPVEPVKVSGTTQLKLPLLRLFMMKPELSAITVLPASTEGAPSLRQPVPPVPMV